MGNREPVMHSGLARVLWTALAVPMLCSAVAGCSLYDYELSVTNNTSEAYYVRVAVGGAGNEGKFWVAYIEPGASGHSTLVWRGDREVPIELLDLSCAVVGVFESDDGQTYRVPGVEGFEGRITPYLSSREMARTGIHPTNFCGGTVDM